MKVVRILFSSLIVAVFILPAAPTVAASSSTAVAQRTFVPGPLLGSISPIPLPPGVAMLPGLDIRVTNDTHDQNEESIAVNPVNPANIIIGANDARGPDGNGGAWWCGVYTTFDAGAHWTMSLLPRTGGLAWDPYCADPSVAFDLRGNAYFEGLGYDPLGGPPKNNTIVVAKSIDGGVTWLPPVSLVSAPTTPPFHDKPYIAVDKSPSSPYRGNIYVSWTNFSSFSGGSSPIYFSRSTDGGVSFSTPAKISGAVQYDQGSQPSVGPNGEVYVSFVAYVGTEERAYVARSDDGGVTFRTPVQATFISDPGSSLPPGNYRTPTLPSSATDNGKGPYGGTVYVVFQDGSSGNSDIRLVYSRDKGQTWSNPVRVNNDLTTNQQFFPFVSTARNGRVDVVFYDRRNDPQDFLLDIYAGISFNGGVSFANRKITDSQINPGLTQFIGDYIGVTSLNASFYPVWTGMVNGQEDVFMEESPVLQFSPVKV